VTLWYRSLLTLTCFGLLVPSLHAWPQRFHKHHAVHYGPVYGTPVQTYAFSAPVQHYALSSTVQSFAVPTSVQTYSYAAPATSYYVVPSTVAPSAASAESLLDVLGRSRDAARLFCRTFGDSGGSGTSSDVDTRLSNIERRLSNIENRLGITSGTGGTGGKVGIKKQLSSAASEGVEAEAVSDPLQQVLRARIDAFIRGEMARLDQLRIDSDLQTQKALIDAIKARFDKLKNE
jgi:hypothetical protein